MHFAFELPFVLLSPVLVPLGERHLVNTALSSTNNITLRRGDRSSGYGNTHLSLSVGIAHGTSRKHLSDFGQSLLRNGRGISAITELTVVI